MSSRFIFTSPPLLPFLLLLTCLCTEASAESIEKIVMPGEVIQGHAKYEFECNKCHQLLDRGAQARLCADCHKEIARDISAKSRMHGRLEDANCRNCHTEHKGRNAKLAVIDKEKFDHDRTGYPLKGAHREIRLKCASCHAAKAKFRDAPKPCNDCHKKDDVHKAGLGKQCESCHDERTWKEDKFDHGKTKFPLVGGKHADVKCKECHADKSFTNAPLACNACHKKDDQEKGHKGRYGTKCESCHTDRKWQEMVFDHDADTHYALHGKHRSAKCDSCHLPEKGLLYRQRLPSKCLACHKKDEQEKGHRGGLGEKCETCHNEKGWKNSSFDHDDTHFPLHDKHKDAKCESCHKGGVSGPNARLKAEKECGACHKKDDQEKGHKGRYGTKCESCHTEKDWKGTTFKHDRDTKYALKGKHIQTKCDACHLPEKGPLSKQKLEIQCVACHNKDDQEKGHKGRYGSKCESCHAEKSWKTITFDHGRDTKYKLKDKHIQAKCDACHLPEKGQIYKQSLDVRCIACHKADDKHKGQLGNKCETCHNERRWQDSPFDHAQSRFLLTGSHVKTECKKCHLTPAFHDASSKCNGCHEKEDTHKRRFVTGCETCHYTGTWKSWDFDHGKTRFRLEGGHNKVECYDCHKEPKAGRATTGRACISCHASEDVHDGGFGGQCEHCHVASVWRKVRR